MNEARLYAVSFGNGNDGVSHMYPDYFVQTDNPWLLARMALCESYSGAWHEHAIEAVEVDCGPAEDGISAVLYEGPEGETQFGAAEAICDVFEDDGPDLSVPWHKPVYMSLAECFGADVLATYSDN